MNELKERILEFDILRVVAVLIIIIMIYFPLNYTINFYEQMDIRTGYIVNQFGYVYW